MPRHQLPVHSPLPLGAALSVLGSGDPRDDVVRTLAGHFGSAAVVLTDSGTSALTLALQFALRRRPGLICALPAFGCFDLATAVLGAGARIVLYDVDPLSLTPDIASVERCVAAGAAAIVVVHLFGLAAPMSELMDIADQTGALVIEDAAQGIGGSWNGRPLGATGDLGILSFGRGKGVTGGGGALLIRDPLERDAWRGDLTLSSGGGFVAGAKLVAQWLLSRPSAYWIPANLPLLGLGETRFHAPDSLGEMSTLSARVVSRTWPLASAEAETRRRNVASIRLFVGSSNALPEPIPRSEPGWLRLPVRGPTHSRSSQLACSRLGIGPSYPRSLDELPELRRSISASDALPGAKELAMSLWTAPTHSLLTDGDLHRVAEWISEHGR